MRGINRRDILKLGCLGATAGQCRAFQPTSRPRARQIGLAPGVFTPGPLNCITDVSDVSVGQVTLIEGDDIRTGVTTIVPHSGNVFQDKVAGGVFVGNAFGKIAGSTQVNELGTIETPIVLTNTLGVFAGIEGIVRWTLRQRGNEAVVSVNAVVGETNDSGLNDIRRLRVAWQDVTSAIELAKAGPVVEGSVGAGTGTICYGWKGGIGTASRVLPVEGGSYTLGVLVQSNFGGVLTMGGAPVGMTLGRYEYSPKRTDGSCMIVVATDAPLSGHQCQRLAARAVFGLARTGSSFSNGSGDFGIAFSTSPSARTKHAQPLVTTYETVTTEGASFLFEAALEATEEAVYNSLLQAHTMQSRYRTVEAIPIDRVRQILSTYGIKPRNSG